MTHQEFIEVSNLCKDFENELNKRISVEEFGIRGLHTIPWHYYKYLRRKLKLDLLPVEWDYNGNSYITVKIPSEEIDCKEVPAIKNFLLFAKKELFFTYYNGKKIKKKGIVKTYNNYGAKLAINTKIKFAFMKVNTFALKDLNTNWKAQKKQEPIYYLKASK